MVITYKFLYNYNYMKFSILQKRILDITLSESTKLLHQGKHNLAAPAALQALKTSVELFGNGHIDTTPAYFALAEANIGMNCRINKQRVQKN